MHWNRRSINQWWLVYSRVNSTRHVCLLKGSEHITAKFSHSLFWPTRWGGLTSNRLSNITGNKLLSHCLHLGVCKIVRILSKRVKLKLKSKYTHAKVPVSCNKHANNSGVLLLCQTPPPKENRTIIWLHWANQKEWLTIFSPFLLPCLRYLHQVYFGKMIKKST